MKYIYRHGRIRSMLAGVCEIIDGIAVIATFGEYHAGLTFKFIAWSELKCIAERKRNQKTVNEIH